MLISFEPLAYPGSGTQGGSASPTPFIVGPGAELNSWKDDDKQKLTTTTAYLALSSTTITEQEEGGNGDRPASSS